MVIRIPRQLGQCIRAKRTELGLTQDALAARVGVSRSTVYRLEIGTTTSLYPAKLLAVLKALGLELRVEEASAQEGPGAAELLAPLADALLAAATLPCEETKAAEAETPSEETDPQAERPFGLADLLAMGDAYKVKAAEIRARDAAEDAAKTARDAAESEAAR